MGLSGEADMRAALGWHTGVQGEHHGQRSPKSSELEGARPKSRARPHGREKDAQTPEYDGLNTGPDNVGKPGS
jgi:hypothetical protein